MSMKWPKFRLTIDHVSRQFNSLSSRLKKILLVISGLSIAVLCGLVSIGQLLPGNEQWLQPMPITKPIDIHSDSTRQNVHAPDARDK